MQISDFIYTFAMSNLNNRTDMIKSINDIIMVGTFPNDKYNRQELEKKTSEELTEIVATDKECGAYDIYDIIDMINDDNIDTENFWLEIIS